MKPTSDSRKFAIYSRKSKFTGKGESIENQIELCRQYIRLHNPGLSENDVLIYEDEGFSGGNTNRPRFQEMMGEIRANHIQAVVCYRLDRISRNVADFSLMYQEFEERNVAFLSVSERYDTSTPSGRAMLSMCTVFAQMERETIAERIRDNMQELAKSGRWLGGNTPTGYQSVPTVGSITADGKVRKAYRLEVIQEEAALVRMIYEKFQETNSLTQTEAFLQQHRIQTKNGKAFTRFSIRAILTNPVYMAADQDAWRYFDSAEVEVWSSRKDFDGKQGVMAYNKTIQKTGRANQTRDMGEWIVAVGKHQGLVSGAAWVGVQRLLEQNRSKSYRKPRSHAALLSGLLFCGGCGGRMRPKLTGRRNGEGERVYTYLCQTKERSRCKNCHSKNPNGNQLDRMVCEQIKILPEDFLHFQRQMEKAKGTMTAGRGDSERQAADLRKALREQEREIQSLVSALERAKDVPARDYITSRINALHEKKEAIKGQLAEWENRSKDARLSQRELERLAGRFSRFDLMFDAMSVEQKRGAIRALVQGIVWDGETAHVLLRGTDRTAADFVRGPGEEKKPLRVDSK